MRPARQFWLKCVGIDERHAENKGRQFFERYNHYNQAISGQKSKQLIASIRNQDCHT